MWCYFKLNFPSGYNMTDFLLMEQNELGKEFRKEYIAGLEMWPVDNSYKVSGQKCIDPNSQTYAIEYMYTILMVRFEVSVINGQSCAF